jgi:hypothetical protein
MTQTAHSTVSIPAVELHLRDKLIDIATALVRVRHGSNRWGLTFDMAREQLEDTAQFQYIVSPALWAKRLALKKLFTLIQQEQKAAEAELVGIDPFEGLVE